MAALTIRRLDAGTRVLQSDLWATNSTIVSAGETCLVCDPSIFPDEIAQIREATLASSDLHILVTHSDFDHTCGVPWFADATVVAGASTAAAIADGSARRKLDESAEEWGTSWPGELRVDRIASGEPIRCGDVDVVAIDARGHIDDGSAFIVGDGRLLLCGDYLSAICQPIVLGSIEATIKAIERLLRAISDHDIDVIIPGHGPVLDRPQAQRIGREDIVYLRALQAAAGSAARDGAGANPAFLAARAVAGPRESRPDFEAFDWLSANARRALAEAGHPAFVTTRALVTPSGHP